MSGIFCKSSNAFAKGCDKQEGKPARLLVVAHRLPVSAVRRLGSEEDSSWSVESIPGDLVNALSGVKEFETIWIGLIDVNVPNEVERNTLTQALAKKGCIPVFLDEVLDLCYNGFCNNILWPLFHYLGLPQDDATTGSFDGQFGAYKKANQMFADVLKIHYEEGDVVWCHDYHLMFLPKLLKEHNRKMKVGWFLHTHFPNHESYKSFPSRSELLRSVLAADLVGFHTCDYVCNFVSTCTSILGPALVGVPEGVKDQEAGNLTRVAAFPNGIDSKQFIHALKIPDVQERIEELKEVFKGRKDRSLDFQALCALYAVTDIALLTSLRDEMNLASYEFVACQEAKKGVLILSEFASAAQSLGAGALLVNPRDKIELAKSIEGALNMSADEREKRQKHNFLHVSTHTVEEWAKTFASELHHIS